MTVKLTLSYDGTDFCGWQIQPNGITVQQVLEDALFAVTGEQIKVTGSGRTDAGVHAQGQVAHFEIEKENIPAEKFSKALNAHLPANVKVIKSEKAEQGFNACRNAKRKLILIRFTFQMWNCHSKKDSRLKLTKNPI